MHIGVDATCWQNTRGYGRHARALLSAFVGLYPNEQYEFFLDSVEAASSMPIGVTSHLLRAGVPTVQAASADGRRSLGDMWRMSTALSSAPLDVVLFPTVYSFVPVATRAKKIVFIHDVIAETFPQLTLPKLSARLFWNAKVALGRRQADAIVTVSEYSRDQIVRKFGVPRDRVFVVGEASDPHFRVIDKTEACSRVRAFGLDPAKRLLAYVGGFGPHKNLLELVTAFASLAARPEFSDITLVMVGECRREVFHSYFNEIDALIGRLGIRSRVAFPGYLPDSDVVALLNTSALLALPSLMEGFGLPAVEAAACGCPVVATTASPLPALLGPAGMYVDPGTGQLERALDRVLQSAELRGQMGQAGVAAAKRLSWRAAAEQLMQVISTVVPSHAGRVTARCNAGGSVSEPRP